MNEVNNIVTENETSMSQWRNLVLQITIFNQGIVYAVKTIQIANINNE